MANMLEPPLVMSISYGIEERWIDSNYMNAFNTQAIKLGVMGVTLLSSSGDDGATSWSVRDHPENCAYFPVFPNTSPYVLSVGGTQGIESGTEEVVNDSKLEGGSTAGGGFSTHFSRPSYQEEALTGYLARVDNTSIAPHNGYNRLGRGYPDVAVVSVKYLVVMNGNTLIFGGTSASTPVVGGMISLVNAARFNARLSAVGWFNPTLYSYYKSFTRDVISGNNKCTCCSPNPICCLEGYTATTGWDPASGFGSIDVGLLLKFMMPVLSFKEPTPAPTKIPTVMPSFRPSVSPSFKLTSSPTKPTSANPTSNPSVAPAIRSSLSPTRRPSATSATPAASSIRVSTAVPTAVPTRRLRPTFRPTARPIK